MVKKATKFEVTVTSTGSDSDVNSPVDTSNQSMPVDLMSTATKAAIDQGKALIAEGRSKADAARAIFEAIKDETKETIVAAFVEGATLTPKGALTYWYNCRRKTSKEASQSR